MTCRCRGPTKGQTPGIAGCGDRAAALLAAACKDSDALLPVPLPHTRALRQKQHRKAQLNTLAPAARAQHVSRALTGSWVAYVMCIHAQVTALMYDSSSTGSDMGSR